MDLNKPVWLTFIISTRLSLHHPFVGNHVVEYGHDGCRVEHLGSNHDLDLNKKSTTSIVAAQAASFK